MNRGKPKGLPKSGGRKAGSQNKVTTTVKETVLNAFIKLQSDPKHNIVQFAKDNPKEFYLIAAKLIPTELSNSAGDKISQILVTVQSSSAEKELQKLK